MWQGGLWKGWRGKEVVGKGGGGRRLVVRVEGEAGWWQGGGRMPRTCARACLRQYRLVDGLEQIIAARKPLHDAAQQGEPIQGQLRHLAIDIERCDCEHRRRSRPTTHACILARGCGFLCRALRRCRRRIRRWALSAVECKHVLGVYDRVPGGGQVRLCRGEWVCVRCTHSCLRQRSL